MMRWLIGMEFSGILRDAMIAAGHEAMSCDLLPTERPGPHFQGDIREVLYYPWDGFFFHAPCTHICVSGARHFVAKRLDGRQQAAVSLFLEMWGHVERIGRGGAEQPIGILSRLFRKPDQIIQPWQFGHGETKATCLWLHNLPALVPTQIAPERVGRVWRMPPSPERWKDRSRTFTGIATAMASQWTAATAIGNCP